MDMDVQIQRPAEPLNDGDGTTAPVRDSVALCAPANKPEDGARTQRLPRDTDRDPSPTRSAAIRQAQHPLADRHVGEHVIDQVRGTLGHPTAPAAWTKVRPPLMLTLGRITCVHWRRASPPSAARVHRPRMVAKPRRVLRRIACSLPEAAWRFATSSRNP
jgi:hypothetical protein